MVCIALPRPKAWAQMLLFMEIAIGLTYASWLALVVITVKFGKNLALDFGGENLSEVDFKESKSRTAFFWYTSFAIFFFHLYTTRALWLAVKKRNLKALACWITMRHTGTTLLSCSVISYLLTWDDIPYLGLMLFTYFCGTLPIGRKYYTVFPSPDIPIRSNLPRYVAGPFTTDCLIASLYEEGVIKSKPPGYQTQDPADEVALDINDF